MRTCKCGNPCAVYQFPDGFQVDIGVCAACAEARGRRWEEWKQERERHEREQRRQAPTQPPGSGREEE